MKVRVIWVGKTKEKYIKDALDKYTRLIRPFCDFERFETKDSRSSSVEQRLKKESEGLFRISSEYVLLHEKGSQLTSVEFAEFLSKGVKWDFVIGGSFGVHEEVYDKASRVVSLSRMTFTHEMCRIILLEQIYRALTIIHKRRYHH